MKRRNLKRNLTTTLFLFLLLNTATAQRVDDYCAFSARVLESIRDGRNADAALEQLSKFNPDTLSASLNTDELRKAFWINVYNIAAQTALKKDSTLIFAKAEYPEKNIIYVAGRHLSLDFILHRILRRSKNKYGLGYVNKLFISEYEKQLRVEYVDYRVHFAVNNGTASCSAIDVYRAATLDDQLNRTTIFFLHKQCPYNDTTRTVSLPKMLEWYKADFGNEKGMYKFLEKLLIIPADKKVKIHYRDYDWTLKLNNFL